MNPDATTTDGELLARVASGDDIAWDQVVSQNKVRLRRVIAARLDPRLTNLVDPSDVQQETFAAAHRQIPSYLRNPALPFFVWLRNLAGDTLTRHQNQHLGLSANSARSMMPEPSCAGLSSILLSKSESGLNEALRAERHRKVESALDGLANEDREILALRHFEELTAEESAAVLGIAEAAARKRSLRALAKVTTAIRKQPDELKS
jgi:RNA polymerase sigma-70 factor (ECF subfamily)